MVNLWVDELGVRNPPMTIQCMLTIISKQDLDLLLAVALSTVLNVLLHESDNILLFTDGPLLAVLV